MYLLGIAHDCGLLTSLPTTSANISANNMAKILYSSLSRVIGLK